MPYTIWKTGTIIGIIAIILFVIFAIYELWTKASKIPYQPPAPESIYHVRTIELNGFKHEYITGKTSRDQHDAIFCHYPDCKFCKGK